MHSILVLVHMMLGFEHKHIHKWPKGAFQLSEAVRLDNVAERHKAILALIMEQGYGDVKELSVRLGVSQHTIRRDLTELETAGLVKRTWGGAVPLEQQPPREIPFLAEKQRIAEAAAAMVAPGEAICIDAGSTVLEVAKRLPDGVSILTNSVNIAYEVQGKSKSTDVTLTGGSVYKRDSMFGLSGPIAVQSIRNTRSVSKAIIGALGIDLSVGVTDRFHYMAEVKREMIRIAKRTILVMDASKVGKQFLELVTPLSEIDTLVTDDRISPEMRYEFEKRGLQVVVV